MFAPDELTYDRFLDGRVMIRQPQIGYRAAMDPVLLAAACPARPKESVLELGCGVGVASLCLGWRVPDLTLTGLELQAPYAALARQNAQENAISLRVIEGDLAQMPAQLREENFDHVIANPPYFPPYAGTAAKDPGRETALREATPLAIWVQQGLKRLRPGGWISIIQQADRLPDILTPLARGAGNIQVLPISSRDGRDAGRVIVRGRKGSAAPFRLVAPLVLHAGAQHLRDGEDLSFVAQSLLRSGEKLQVPL
ncbi:methyltransferase [Thioclava sp. SK-1]|uniref:tRNA1(Val) (adenine(37)-N6)-methyltransferase n=1 Tax=Thioclava sp. SK-1 TaxID=1889770 RepID=UPI00082706EE|nr:methyltransferase [Thioclava sp. SK-1]OCX62846.1 methyltransferase [Thioclava sp. SK-1]